MTGLTIRQYYNEWTNSNHKENANSVRDLWFNHWGLVIAIEVFRGEFFLEWVLSALSRWRQHFFKGRQLERAEEQPVPRLQSSRWRTTPDQTKSVIWGMSTIFLCTICCVFLCWFSITVMIWVENKFQLIQLCELIEIPSKSKRQRERAATLE